MDRTGIDGNHDVGERSVEIQIETEEEVSTRREQGADGVQKCLSPLIISVRPLGLYFTGELVQVKQHSDRNCRRECRDWSHSQVYATIMLAVTWINATRNCIVFDGTETLRDLFLKLGVISGILLTAVSHTTYYFANHTGSLSRVFHQVDLSKPDFHKKCSCRVNVVTVISWLIAATGMVYYACVMFTRDYLNEVFFMFLARTFRSSTGSYVAKAICVVLELPSIAITTFAQAMNYTGPCTLIFIGFSQPCLLSVFQSSVNSP